MFALANLIQPSFQEAPQEASQRAQRDAVGTMQARPAAQDSKVSATSQSVDVKPTVQRKKTQAPVAPPASHGKGDGKLDLGIAVRGRYDLRFNDVGKNGQGRTSSHLSYDTIILTADYDSSFLFGSLQYRFYGGSFIYGSSSGYKGYPGEISFPMYGYVGAKIDKSTKITLGLAPVPFDDRWWGSSFLNSVGFVYGLEEVYDVGAVFSHVHKRWSFDAGFFPTTIPNAIGRSADSARYSVNFVRGGTALQYGSSNDERYIGVARVRYHLLPDDADGLVLTGSAWVSTVHNYTTRRNGQRRAFSLSLKRKSGPWRFKLMGARQDMDLKNPGTNEVVTVGDYDSPYNIAARGTIGFAEIARTIDTGKLPVKLDMFVNYARVWKDIGHNAPDTDRLSVGAFWSDKATNRFRVWSEYYLGRNDPYIGAGQFTNGAGFGGDNRYKSSFLIIFGYYL
ncbi:hypothetical protein AA21291_0332 [Swaminathania salitolerans LMG 21291]|nr:hypothetical protein AA21291_0332 [Swaminathania salitolerans LMG 21291]